MNVLIDGAAQDVSLPAWGAWIEIESLYQIVIIGIVAPRMGSVD